MRLCTFLLTGFFMLATSHAAFGVPSASAQSPTSPQSHDEPVVTRLANGLTVVVKKDDRFPLVSLRLYVHAGSAYEDDKDAGMSHVLEHMVFKGTEKRPKGAVATEIEKSGGYLNAATSFDYTVYLTDMTSEHWKTGLDVLKDMAFHPTLDPQELESEKDVIVAELKRGEDNPRQRVFRMAQQAALKGTSYYNPIIGYEETIRSFTSERIREYIARHYQPQSMMLLVCGNVDVDDALAEAGKLFGDLKNTQSVTPPVVAKELPAPRGFTLTTEKGPWNKVHLALTLPAPSQNDARTAQLDVLAHLLGGDTTSRFYRTYKYEKRLVDGISVGNYGFERLGMLYIQVVLDEDKLVPFWEEFSKDLANLDSLRFTQEELSRAKLNIEDELFRSKETLAGYASKLGHFEFFDNGVQGEANYLRIVQATDQETLTALTQEIFRPDALSFVALLPEDVKAPEGAPALDAWIVVTMNKNWKKSAVTTAQTQAAMQGTEPEIVDLGDNRTLILTPDTALPYTAVTMAFKGGDSLLALEDQGLAAFTASLLTKGTQKLNATAMEEYQSDRAASFNASSGRQSFSITMNTPSRFTGDMFTLLGDVLASPALAAEEADRVKQNQITAITMQEDQPTSLAFRRMYPFLFSGHPYGFLQLGEKERVAQFTADNAQAFWKKQAAQPWVMSVCGTFGRDAIIAAAKELPVPVQDYTDPLAPEWGTSKNMDLQLPGRNQAHLLMVFPTVGYGHDDEAALDVLQNILAGQSGLLFRDMRDVQGLGYTVSALSWKTQRTGALIFYIGTEPEKMKQAEEGFHTVINTLHSTLLDTAELERGKNQISGDYYREHQSLASRSAEAAVLTLLHHPLDAARKLVEKSQTVDAKAVQSIAQKYLKKDAAYVITVKP